MGDQIAGAFKAGRYRSASDRAVLAGLMLWLAVRGDATIAERVRTRPTTLTWLVTPRPGMWSIECNAEDSAAVVGGEAPPDMGAAAGTAPEPSHRGHATKIAAAVAALEEAGTLPAGLRPKERECRVLDELRRQGLKATEMPSRTAIGRWFSRRALH